MRSCFVPVGFAFFLQVIVEGMAAFKQVLCSIYHYGKNVAHLTGQMWIATDLSTIIQRESICHSEFNQCYATAGRPTDSVRHV